VIGGPHHGALGGVDVGLGMVLDPALMAAELGSVDGGQPGPLNLARRPLGGTGHRPVVGVHEIELEPSHISAAIACMSAFIACTQRTNALGSLGNCGSRTRWTATPC